MEDRGTEEDRRRVAPLDGRRGVVISSAGVAVPHLPRPVNPMDPDHDDLAALLDPGARYEHRGLRWVDGPHETWAAFDRVLGREVALNMPRLNLARDPIDPIWVRRFLAAARGRARLHHPHILPVLDLGLADGLPYFTTPLLPTRCLGQLFEREPGADGMMLLRRSVAALVGVGRAIEHARRRGVVFTQIRPNVIQIGDEPGVSFLEGGWDDCLLDPADEADLGGESGYLLSGNPGYMSPEQILGSPKAYAPPSDVYCLGGVLYFMLYGSPPNHRPGSDTVETIRALVDGTLDVRSRAILRPEFRPRGWSGRRALRDVERLCLRALDLDPARRPPDAGAFARELEACSTGRL
jgi:serine/threonine protein kinase